MIMMPYGSRSSLQLTGRAHFWHPIVFASTRRAWRASRAGLGRGDGVRPNGGRRPLAELWFWLPIAEVPADDGKVAGVG
jgi:hypothetical protein